MKDIMEFIKELEAQDLAYDDIAKALNKAGYPSKRGGQWTRPMVSHHLLDAGVRRKDQVDKGPRKKKRRHKSRSTDLGLAQSAEVTKWDVLKAIESCADFTTSSRHALMDLVWKEVNK